MSETPIFDNIGQPTDPPVGMHFCPDSKCPYREAGALRHIIEDKYGDHCPLVVAPEKKWWEKILTPIFRKWAYGVTATALAVGAVWAGKPEFLPVVAPLVMAIFYVDTNGEPRAN